MFQRLVAGRWVPNSANCNLPIPRSPSTWVQQLIKSCDWKTARKTGHWQHQHIQLKVERKKKASMFLIFSLVVSWILQKSCQLKIDRKLSKCVKSHNSPPGLAEEHQSAGHFASVSVNQPALGIDGNHGPAGSHAVPRTSQIKPVTPLTAESWSCFQSSTVKPLRSGDTRTSYSRTSRTFPYL